MRSTVFTPPFLRPEAVSVIGPGTGDGVTVGFGVGETGSLSVKASCWDAPVMVTRPSAHAVKCLVSNAEP